MLFEIYLWVLSFLSVFVSVLWLIVNRASRNYEKKLNEIKEFPLITIVVPVWNESKSIISTLKCIINQSYPKNKMQILIVDDKSTDNTIELIEDFISKSKNLNIRLIKHKTNLGKGGALNTVLQHAKGEFFWVYDADSLASKDLLKNMTTHFYDPENKDVAAVVAITLIKNLNNWVEKMQTLEYVMASFSRKVMGDADTLHITNALSLFKTKILKKIKGFDVGNLTEDFEIATRLRYNGYRIVMCENGNFRTNVPSTFGKMWKQRVRWFRGFIYNNYKYKQMIFNKDFKLLGLFQIPLEVFILLCVFFSIGLFFYHTVKMAIDFSFKVYIMRYSLLDFKWPTFLQFVLNLNWKLLFPTLIVLIFGLYLYYSAHKYVGEKWKFYIPSLLYLFVYPLFRSLQWLHAFVLELGRAEKKW